jgi:hypothetical protein
MREGLVDTSINTVKFFLYVTVLLNIPLLCPFIDVFQNCCRSIFSSVAIAVNSSSSPSLLFLLII